jgi:hypothetical protein
LKPKLLSSLLLLRRFPSLLHTSSSYPLYIILSSFSFFFLPKPPLNLVYHFTSNTITITISNLPLPSSGLWNIYILNLTLWHRSSDHRLSAKLVPTLRIQGATWSSQRVPTAVNLGSVDPEPLPFHSSSSKLSSLGWVDPVPDPLLHTKYGSAGDRTRDFWMCTQERLTTRPQRRSKYLYTANLNEKLTPINYDKDIRWQQ